MADTPESSAEGALDPSEVEQLIAPSTEPASPPQRLIRADGAKTPGAPRVAPFDFRNPSFLSEVELRRLRLVNEDFVRYLSARLSLYLRMEFGLKLASLTTVTYAKFTESLPNPTHINLFKIEPLVGVGILDLHPRLALTIADRLLGGRGNSVKAERSLTEIEIALVEDIILIMLEEWCGQWKSGQDLTAVVIGHENSGRFLQTSPKDAIVLALTLEATLGDCTAPIQIAVPYYLVEPIVRKLQSRRQHSSAVKPAPKHASWQPAYDRITMPVRAEWAALELTVRELSSLRVGDVIELPAALFHETRVLLNGTPKFIGSVGLDADRVAVQITRKLPPEENSYANPDGRKNP